MGKNWLCYLGLLAGAMVFHMYYTAWFSWYFLILILVLPLFSLILSLPGMLTVRIQWEVPASVRRGEKAEARFILKGKYPVGLCVLRFWGKGKKGRRKTLRHKISPGGFCSLSLNTAHCTCLTTVLRRARVYDFLGLFSLPLSGKKMLLTEVCPIPTAPEPLPHLEGLLSAALKPLPGGFSEIHELREYHPGDSMRDIHWKLSAKTDTPIVREPQEAIRPQILLTLRLFGPGYAADSCLDQLSFLSGWLLDQNIPHRVACFCGPEDTIQDHLACRADLETFLSKLLRKLPSIFPWQENQDFIPLQGVWHYPIEAREVST